MLPIVHLLLSIGLLAATLAPGGTFTDDDENVHEGGIEAIAAAGITKGCNPPFNDRFCPNRDITRAEMATMMARALALPATDTDYFIDDDGHPLEGGINRVAEAGLTKGCNPPDNDEFCPNRTLTRAEAAAFISRARGLPPSPVDYFDDDSGHILEGAINRIAHAKITVGCNPPTNNFFCPQRRLTRAELATLLTRALPSLVSMKPPARPPLDWALVVSGLSSPVQTISPPGEDRLLIAQLGGVIRTFEAGSLNAVPFLDISGPVVTGGERGLLSIALHPDYPGDRRLFAYFSGSLQSGGSGNHTTYLVEYDISVDLESAGSPRTILAIDQPAGNHNGGHIAFGSDGYLYLSTGDGGGANDSTGPNARNLNSLLGKVLRIGVDGATPYEIPDDNPYVGQAGRDEIWASGLRNPWRWSFDGDTMFIGDVGQSSREEINAVRVVPVGYDFGWARYEGSVCNPNDTDPSCSTSGLTFPVTEYGRSIGGTVTGGVVYRGPTVRSLDSYYIYGDFLSGRIRAFRLLNGDDVEAVDLTGPLLIDGVVDFTVDSGGELIATSLFGSVYRLTGG